MVNNHQSTIQAVDIHALIGDLAQEMQRTVKEAVKNLNAAPRKELLKPAEAAKEYGMTEGYWRKQIFNRTIPYVKMGKSVRLRRRDIEAFIENNIIEA